MKRLMLTIILVVLMFSMLGCVQPKEKDTTDTTKDTTQDTTTEETSEISEEVTESETLQDEIDVEVTELDDLDSTLEDW